MNFRNATESYESWLGSHLEIVPEDLAQKHELMKADDFSFFRATFYRWCQLWPEQCADCDKAPEVLAVGDLHVENFGTWRDAEARLIWGINDFDEVAPMPYTIDLVRLAASAHLAIDAGHLNITHHEACSELLAGYKECLEAGGQPWILAGKHPWLRELIVLRDPTAFWEKLEGLSEWNGRIPKEARRGIERLMPVPNLPLRFSHRVAGLGSLGRHRFVATAGYGGSPVCREAKALAPSAWLWAKGKLQSTRIRYQEALNTSVRAVDPFVQLKNAWIVRRLAPDCIRVELGNVAKDKEKHKLLRAMGWETANVHVGSKQTKAILRDLSRRPNQWLHEAVGRMVKATRADWDEWRGQSSQSKPPKSGTPKSAKSGKKKARAAAS